MKRDMSVTVTRDIRVTSQVPRHCDIARRSRVSHATTTTPHHTMYFWASGLFSETQSRIRNNGHLRAASFGFGDEIR